MNKLILLVLVCTIITTGYLQEISTSHFPPNVGDNELNQVWLLHGQQGKSKPCAKKNEKNYIEEPWIPSYSSRVTHHLSPESFLQPQSLKNEDYILEPNPDGNTENNGLGVPERRSLNSAYNQPVESEDDCSEEPTSPATTPSSDNTAAIIKDCLKRKQKQSLGSSRRSMSEPESASSDSDESAENESLDSEVLSRKSAYNKGKPSEFRSKETLLNPRVCYACSTATNPSCWEPDKKTTVKYCTKEKSCVTKSFGAKNALTVIRDCADSCEETSVIGIEPKFNKCKVCHSDLCNGAFSINPYNLVIIMAICIVKYTF